MIVAEGCDGTGKSTLVRSLADDLSLRVGQRGTQNRDELYKVTREDTYRSLAHAVEGYHPPFIWDRLGPFSDPIYSRVLGRDCAFTHEEMRHCMSIFKAIRCPIIICSVPFETARDNAEEGHQLSGVLGENFEYIWQLYERLKDALMLEAHTIVYDYRVEKGYDVVKEFCETYINRRKVREWH
jgi:hypothetical protein